MVLLEPLFERKGPLALAQSYPAEPPLRRSDRAFLRAPGAWRGDRLGLDAS